MEGPHYSQKAKSMGRNIDLQILEMDQENGKPTLVLSCVSSWRGRLGGKDRARGTKVVINIHESRVNKEGFQNKEASKQVNKKVKTNKKLNST